HAACARPQSRQLLLRTRCAPIYRSDMVAVYGQYARRIALAQGPGHGRIRVVADCRGQRRGRRALGALGDGRWQAFISLDQVKISWGPDDIYDSRAAQIYINPLTFLAWLTQWLPLEAKYILLINS
ncbi:DNA repair exonuclease, partial [Serratia quinivorans]